MDTFEFNVLIPKGLKLSPEELIVYSYLVASRWTRIKKEIIDDTRLHKNLVRRAIDRLISRGLVTGEKDYQALPPQAGDFWERKSEKDGWQHQIAYFRYIVSSGLTTRENLLFWRIVSQPNKLPVYYLSLGIARRTVFDLINKLRSKGLLLSLELKANENRDNKWWTIKKTKKPSINLVEKVKTDSLPLVKEENSKDSDLDFVDYYGKIIPALDYHRDIVNTSKFVEKYLNDSYQLTLPPGKKPVLKLG